MQSLKKKGLKSKFGKFAISTEKAKKVNGGYGVECYSAYAGGNVLMFAETLEGLNELSWDSDISNCGDIF